MSTMAEVASSSNSVQDSVQDSIQDSVQDSVQDSRLPEIPEYKPFIINNFLGSRAKIFEEISPSMIVEKPDGSKHVISRNLDDLNKIMYDNLIAYAEKHNITYLELVNYLTAEEMYRELLSDCIYASIHAKIEIDEQSEYDVFHYFMIEGFIHMAMRELYRADILNRNNNIDNSNDKFRVAAISADNHGYTQLSKYFIDRGGLDFRSIQKSDNDGKNSAMTIAAMVGHKKLFLHTLSLGADNYRESMILAAFGGHNDIVKIIIEIAESKPFEFCLDSLCGEAIRCSASFGEVEVTKTLLQFVTVRSIEQLLQIDDVKDRPHIVKLIKNEMDIRRSTK